MSITPELETSEIVDLSSNFGAINLNDKATQTNWEEVKLPKQVGVCSPILPEPKISSSSSSVITRHSNSTQRPPTPSLPRQSSLSDRPRYSASSAYQYNLSEINQASQSQSRESLRANAVGEQNNQLFNRHLQNLRQREIERIRFYYSPN